MALAANAVQYSSMLKPISLLVALAATSLHAQDLPAFEHAELPGLLETYKQLHAHPELSHFEVNTSALVAAELRKAGYTVTDHLGIYPDGSKAYRRRGHPQERPRPHPPPPR